MSYWCMCLIILNTIVFQSNANSNITIINYENKNDGMGNSNYKYTLSDGSIREESVRIVNKDTENEYPVIEGIYIYRDNLSGVEYIVRYVADNNGFRPDVGRYDLRSITYPQQDTFLQTGAALISTLQGGGIG